MNEYISLRIILLFYRCSQSTYGIFNGTKLKYLLTAIDSIAIVEEISRKNVYQKTKSLSLSLQLPASIGKRTIHARKQISASITIRTSDAFLGTALRSFVKSTTATVRLIAEPNIASKA